MSFKLPIPKKDDLEKNTFSTANTTQTFSQQPSVDYSFYLAVNMTSLFFFCK